MGQGAGLSLLFSEPRIRARVGELAREIATSPVKPDVALPILNGSFIFAADLLRDLHVCGLALPVEFVRLRSYGHARAAEGGVRVVMGIDESLRGQCVLLIDGVLDRGHTLLAARQLALEAGASAVTTVVVIDKMRPDALLRADFACFTGVSQFVVGYGMDDAGRFRSLPWIAAVE